MSCDGVLNILKPPGMTSHDVISVVRRTLGLRRVGHAGTLDPDATGVLPVFCGLATRFIEYFDGHDKTYRFWVTFGEKTDSGDDSGHVIATSPVLPLKRQEIENALVALTGPQEQIPPMYSAVHYQGKRLYELARAGLVVERAPRSIEIKRLQLLLQTPSQLLIEAACSKGTYIRTLAETVAERLDMVGTVSFLLRTEAGPFSVHEANTLEEIREKGAALLQPVDRYMGLIPALQLSPSEVIDFAVGKTIIPTENKQWPSIDAIIRVYDDAAHFLGMGRRTSQGLRPVKVLPDAGSHVDI